MATVTKPVALDETLQATNSALVTQSTKLNDIIAKLQLIATALGNPELIGDTDISGIADGTITGAIAEIDSDVTALQTDMLTAQGDIDDIEDALSDDVVTVTGTPISITTLSAQYAQSTKINIEPIQSGSGDPSPSNIRPITGSISANLIIKDSDNVTVKTFTFAFGQTVFGGNLDVESGVLTIDRTCANILWGDTAITSELTNTTRKIFTLTARGTSAFAMCNIAPIVRQYSLDEVHCYVDGDLFALFLPPNTSNDTQIQIAYSLASPYTIQLTGAQVELLKGVNNITSDGDSVTLIYRDGEVATLADVVALDKKIDASGSSGHVYSTNEQIVGTWYDGKTIYERTVVLPSSATLTANSWSTISSVTITSEDVIIKTELYLSADKSINSAFGRAKNGSFQVFSSIGLTIDIVTIQYTKTTD